MAKPTPSPPEDVILPHGTSAREDPTNLHANLGLTKMVPDIEIYSHNPWEVSKHVGPLLPYKSEEEMIA